MNWQKWFKKGLRFKQQAKLPKQICCIHIEKEQLHIATAKLDSKSMSVTNVSAETLPCQSETAQFVLMDYVKKNRLTGMETSLLLHPTEYRLLLLDAPEVPKSELKQAALWLCKDLVRQPIETVVMDVFLAPTGNQSEPKKMYVVLADLIKLSALRELITGTGLKLMHINVMELALLELLRSQKQPAGLIFDGFNLLIVDHQAVALSRTLDHELSPDSGHFSAEQFSAELARSADFFQAQLGGKKLQQVLVLPHLWHAHQALQHIVLDHDLPCSILPVDAFNQDFASAITALGGVNALAVYLRAVIAEDD